MAITADELKQFKAGEIRPVFFTDPKEISSTRAICSYVTLTYPELKLKFTTKLFREKKLIMITAERVN